MTISLREIEEGKVVLEGGGGAGESDLQVYKCPNTEVGFNGDKIHFSRKNANKEAVAFVLNTGKRLFWVEHYLGEHQEGDKGKVGERSRVLKSGEFIEFRPSPRITNVLSAERSRSPRP